MKPKITEAWESLGAVTGTRYDLSRWSADRATLWVTLWSDRLKRVESGVYRYTLCEDGDLKRTTGERHHANVREAIKRGVPMRGFLVWPKEGQTAQGHRGVEDVDATRQYAVEVESHDGNLVVALAKGL
ncbi:MAG: hypothetical protein K2Y16_07850 [Burkholderiales bacterium]|nr:hypothetical protein [Burkholderiales bacterium]